MCICLILLGNTKFVSKWLLQTLLLATKYENAHYSTFSPIFEIVIFSYMPINWVGNGISWWFSFAFIYLLVSLDIFSCLLTVHVSSSLKRLVRVFVFSPHFSMELERGKSYWFVEVLHIFKISLLWLRKWNGRWSSLANYSVKRRGGWH